MTGKQHLILGISTGTAAGLCLLSHEVVSVTGFSFFIIGSAIGSLFPDVDTPESTLGQTVPHIARFIQNHFGHRTITHDLFGWVVATILAYFFLDREFVLEVGVAGFALGAWSHMFLDSLTIKGVPTAWLFIKKGFLKDFHLLPKFLRCRTGSFWSWILTVAASVGGYVAIFKLFGGL